MRILKIISVEDFELFQYKFCINITEGIVVDKHCDIVDQLCIYIQIFLKLGLCPEICTGIDSSKCVFNSIPSFKTRAWSRFSSKLRDLNCRLPSQ